MDDFSLFEGDPLNRLFLFLGLRSNGVISLAARVSLLLLITCVPTMYFAWHEGYATGQPRALNFFGDLGALAQAFLGYPLFVIAESVISKKTRSAAKHFLTSGVIPPEGLGELRKVHERMNKIRRWLLPDLICLALGFCLSMGWLYDETHNQLDTWHAIGAPGVQTPTLAGWWVAIFGIPIFNYWWLRWIWKVQLWCWYLAKVSRQRLRLIASHPDLTGGLGFVSEAQTSFALVLFAFGIGCIAPLAAYKIEVEGVPLFSYSVGGPLIGFVIGAPIFFTLPLLLFTKQLSRTKKRAVDAYQERATEAALFFERSWLNACHEENCEALLGEHLQGMKNLNIAYEHIKRMRVVPFDTKSFSQLFGSTFGSLLPLVFKTAEIPEPAAKLLEVLKSLLEH